MKRFEELEAGERSSSFKDRVLVEGTDGRRRKRWRSLNESGHERQDFLLSAAACTISAYEIAGWSDEYAYEVFERIRFSENGGAPFCPFCPRMKDGGFVAAYTLKITRRTKREASPTTIYKCSACERQFSISSGTLLASHKMPVKMILYLVARLLEGVNGVAATQLRRSVRVSYKTALVFSKKAALAVKLTRAGRILSGKVEVDGTEFPKKRRRRTLDPYGKRKSIRTSKKKDSLFVVAARERGPGGQSVVTVVFGSESQGADFVKSHVQDDAELVTDAGAWGSLDMFEREVVVHDDGFLVDGINTNLVESLFKRIKAAARGVHFRMRGDDLDLYAEMTAFREDYRNVSNGDQWLLLIWALTHTRSNPRVCGTWQRWRTMDVTRRRRTIWRNEDQIEEPLALTA